MEPKKNVKYDVHRYRSMLLSLGFSISLLLVIAAFMIKAPLKNDVPDPDEPEVYLAYHDEVKPWTEKKPALKKELKRQRVINPVETKANPTPLAEPEAEVENEPAPFEPVVENEPEPVEEKFIRLEKYPMPVGGYGNFYQILRKNLRYPFKAKKNGIEGKVFVEFAVGTDGEPTDFVILKGIRYGCDEEAIRVIRLSNGNQENNAENLLRPRWYCQSNSA